MFNENLNWIATEKFILSIFFKMFLRKMDIFMIFQRKYLDINYIFTLISNNYELIQKNDDVFQGNKSILIFILYLIN